MPAFLDTNILIYYADRQDPATSEPCLKLLQKADRREVQLVTTDMVIAEAVWVLQSRSDLSRENIRDLLLPIVRLPGLRLPNKPAWPRIFDLYCERNVDFIDAYNAVWMERAGIREVYSYGHDFDRFENAERLEP